MILRILIDNNTFIDQYYLGEPALSFYIEDGESTILFDTGYSDAFIGNAKLMGIDLGKVDSVVISHGHVDHTGGLEAYAKAFGGKPLYAHPDAFRPKRAGDINSGSPLGKDELAKLYELRLSLEPVKVSENLLFLGAIPRNFGFEEPVMTGMVCTDEGYVPDYDMDDSALVYTGKDGLFIITGCSHAGICNIIEYARKVTGVDKVAGVVGGFHLFKTDARLDSTIEYLKSLDIQTLAPCHCVSLPARCRMMGSMDILETGVGMELRYE